jgi:hypothetical protein
VAKSGTQSVYFNLQVFGLLETEKDMNWILWIGPYNHNCERRWSKEETASCTLCDCGTLANFRLQHLGLSFMEQAAMEMPHFLKYYSSLKRQGLNWGLLERDTQQTADGHSIRSGSTHSWVIHLFLNQLLTYVNFLKY